MGLTKEFVYIADRGGSGGTFLSRRTKSKRGFALCSHASFMMISSAGRGSKTCGRHRFLHRQLLVFCLPVVCVFVFVLSLDNSKSRH